ncbi:MAG: hypothetical protein JWL61_4739 [Gemmatimonadetes bacterium]|nr:hypothetical protein [Gemmatimonadota bacterium]
MSKDKSSTGQKHDASDRALDRSATEEPMSGSGPTHDPDKIRQHDDTGKDRLFEGRQQHDEAEKNSEKSRLAKDVDRHHHSVDDDVADAGSGASAKRKN